MLRKVWLALGIAWLLAVWVLSLIPVPPLAQEVNDKIEHATTYALLMLWWGQLGFPPMRVVLALIAMGIGIEFAQGLTPYRSFDVHDMLANTLGVSVASLLLLSPLGRVLQMLEKK